MKNRDELYVGYFSVILSRAETHGNQQRLSLYRFGDLKQARYSCTANGYCTLKAMITFVGE